MKMERYELKLKQAGAGLLKSMTKMASSESPGGTQAVCYNRVL
jgi:hypothetical protein